MNLQFLLDYIQIKNETLDKVSEQIKSEKYKKLPKEATLYEEKITEDQVKGYKTALKELVDYLNQLKML